jgi:serine phosphatase RsbU (regulator of sigma subunit)
MIKTPTVIASLSHGLRQWQVDIAHSPFTVGRLPESDLTLDDPSVSRRHAEIQFEDGSFILVDLGSRHGTYVNSRKIERYLLRPHDEVRFGGKEGPILHFGVEDSAATSSVRSLISRIDTSNDPVPSIEKLNWFLEAARKLNDVGAIDQILAALVETTLDLTRVERGYVMLRDASTGNMRLVAGRASDGAVLTDASTISHSAIRRAIESADPFIVTDTLKSQIVTRSESVVAQNIRTVICMPLRSRHRLADAGSGSVLGVLYLDNRLAPGKLAQIDNDLLKTIAAEAAALVENAQLALEEEHARRYREELKIAASIQQGLMPAQPPTTGFATISARYAPCKEIGGDFYDAIASEDSVSLVLADVSGKGVSAALLAQTLQGMVYALLLGNQPLDEIAHALNRYICARAISKYATLVILRLHRSGKLEYVNCGHVHPLLKTPQGIQQLPESEMPVGLIADAHYRSHTVQIASATRLLLISDGVTEAENESSEFYGDDRLEQALASSRDLEDIFQSLSGFCGCASASDDCTMVEIAFAPAVNA